MAGKDTAASRLIIPCLRCSQIPMTLLGYTLVGIDLQLAAFPKREAHSRTKVDRVEMNKALSNHWRLIPVITIISWLELHHKLQKRLLVRDSGNHMMEGIVGPERRGLAILQCIPSSSIPMIRV